MSTSFRDTAAAIIFSDEELKRINSLLQDDTSLATLVLKSKLERIPNKYQNKMVKIIPWLHGVRVGKKNFYDRLFSLIQSSIGNSSHSFHREGLELYKKSVVYYLDKKHNEFNEILTDEQIDLEENFLTNNYFEELEKKIEARNIEVSKSICEFYLLWGFPRDEELDNKYKLVPVDNLEVNAPVSKVIEVTDGIKNDLVALEKAIEKVKFRVESDYVEKKELKKKLKEIDLQIDIIKNLAEKAQNNADFDKSIYHLKNNFSQQGKEVKNHSNHIKQLLKNQRLDKKNEKRLTKIESEILKIQNNHGNLIEKFELTKENIQSLLRFKQNLRTGSLKVLPKKKYVSEKEFILKWYSELENGDWFKISLDQAVVYHTIFKTSLVSILEDSSLFESWLSSLGWMPGNKIIAVNPVWTREEDWVDGVQHLQGGTIVNFMPSLTIHNYNCGIPEASFFPTLLRLTKQKDDVRVVLVPSESIEEKVRSELLTIAPLISRNDIHNGLGNSIGSTIEYKAYRGSATEIIPGENFHQWDIGGISATGSSEKAILEIAKGTGIIFPNNLFERFCGLLRGLSKYFNEDDSMVLAGKYTLFPWTETELGESMQKIFCEKLSDSINRKVF